MNEWKYVEGVVLSHVIIIIILPGSVGKCVAKRMNEKWSGTVKISVCDDKKI